MTPRLGAITAVLALLLAALPGCGLLAENDKKAGIALYNDGKFTEAIPRLEKSLRWTPGDHEARRFYALALTRGGRGNDAIEQWLRVLKLSPDWAEGHYWFGIAYVSTDRIKQAVEQWVQAAEIDSTHIGAHYNLGLAYVKMGLYPLAVEEWSTVLLLDPTHHDARVNRGRIRVFQGDTAGGLEDFLIAVAVRPEFAVNWLSLGETYFLMDDSAKAVAAIDSFFSRNDQENDIASRARVLRERIVAGEKAPPVNRSALGIPTEIPATPGQ